MAQPDEREIRRFRKVLKDCTLWLSTYFSDEAALSTDVARLVHSLRRYLVHCRRKLRENDCGLEKLYRRRRKIELVVYELWKRQQGQWRE